MSDLAFQIPKIEAEISEATRRQDEITSEFVARANEEKIATLNEITQLRATINAMQDRAQRTDVRARNAGKFTRIILRQMGGDLRGVATIVRMLQPKDADRMEMGD